MENSRKSREWRLEAGIDTGMNDRTGDDGYGEAKQRTVGLEGFLRPGYSQGSRENESQNFNQRGASSMKFDSEKLDGYITKILGENEILKNQNAKLDNELAKLIEKVRDLEGVHKQRCELSNNVQERARTRLAELKRLEDQNSRLSKELRINKELSIQLNRSSIRQSNSHISIAGRRPADQLVIQSNSISVGPNNSESRENIFLEHNFNQTGNYTAGTDDMADNLWDSSDPIQIEDTPAEDPSEYYLPKYSQSDLMSNRKRLFDTSEVSEIETHKKVRPSGTAGGDSDYNQHYSMQMGNISSPLEKKRQHAVSYHGDHLSNAEQDLCNFQSFSKQYVTFDKNGQMEENKENYGMQPEFHQKAPKGPPKKLVSDQQKSSKGTYADRYLHMMKNKRNSSNSRQPTPGKNDKKQSMFDEIRQQAVSKVQKRYN